MKEFVYYDKSGLAIPLGDEIFISKTLENEKYLIANSEDVDALLIAPEIDLYLKNSQDSIIEKAKNVSILYEARAVGFDYAKDTDFSQEVGNNILIVGEFENLQDALKAEGFGVLSFKENEIKDVNGHIGSLTVELYMDEKIVEVQTDQIIWKNAPDFALKQSGVLDVSTQDTEQIIEELLKKSGSYSYKNFTFYDSSICQYHERRDEICGKCAEVCPTVAITKDDEKRHLKFSHIDCHGCGGCISVCPSGAIDYSQMPQLAFYEIAKMYEDKIPLIIPRKMFDFNIDVDLPCGILPFAIEGEKYLHEAHFLTLLQESGSQVLFFTDFLSKGSKDVINIINQIYQLKYGIDGILVAMNENELKNRLQIIQKIPNSNHTIFSDNLIKREIFSKRVSFIIGDEDLGVVKSGEHVRYGDVVVNDDNCTLCLSCVEACNVGALVADASDNSLKLNASICTTCGYCEATCPEKNCLEVIRGEIPLNPTWYNKKTLAKDTLFECQMCHKPFATTKSVLKIAKMMTPLFKGDEAKVKSLYCCADCKPKVMIGAALNHK